MRFLYLTYLLAAVVSTAASLHSSSLSSDDDTSFSFTYLNDRHPLTNNNINDNANGRTLNSAIYNAFAAESVGRIAPFLGPMPVEGFGNEHTHRQSALRDTDAVMDSVARQFAATNAVHMPVEGPLTTISGRRVAVGGSNTNSSGSGVAFDQQQMWFNVSFTGPSVLFLTMELMCLNGKQTPNVFRGFQALGGSGKNKNAAPTLTILDTQSLQSTNVSNGVGPYCGRPVTLPIAYAVDAAHATNFSLFKDTEPNFNFAGPNWVVFYGYSLVGANGTNATSSSSSSFGFVPAAFSPQHLQSLAASTASKTPADGLSSSSASPPLPRSNSNSAHRAETTDVQQRLNRKLGLVQRAPTDVPRRRRIEWLGDSVTVGYGTLCHQQNATKNTYKVESGWYAWPNPTCAFFGAECHVSGWSGKGLIRNNGGSPPPAMDEYYLRTIATSNLTDWRWNFSSWVPDAVVMRLGTNDFANTDDGPEFMKNYTDAVVRFFVDTFTHYGPQVQVFVACGPSRTDYCQGLSDAMKIVRNPSFPITAAATNTHFIDLRQIYFEANDPNHGGTTNVCFGHPDTNAAYMLATRAIGAISAVMNWNEWDE